MAESRIVFVTPRQYTILRALLYDAATNEQIAKRLFISVDTVKTHLRRIYLHLGVRGRTGIAVAVYSGALNVLTVAEDMGSVRSLLDELRQLQGVA